MHFRTFLESVFKDVWRLFTYRLFIAEARQESLEVRVVTILLWQRTSDYLSSRIFSKNNPSSFNLLETVMARKVPFDNSHPTVIASADYLNTK